MSRKGQGSISLLPQKQKTPHEDNSSWVDIAFELQPGSNEGDIIEIKVDLEEDREALKSVYELFHAEIGNIPLLTPEQEKDLSRRIQEESDSEAFQTFVLANLRLVIACARKIKDRMGHQSILSFMDLVQEGILGLMIAVRRFDYKRNTRFSTYGIPWIYQRIRMALVQHRHGFSVPGYAGTSVHTMSEHIQAFKDGRMEDIPSEVDMDRLKALVRISGLTVPIDYPEESGKGHFSLNPDKVCSNIDHISGISGENTFSASMGEENLFRREVLELLESRLSKKEFDVLCRRFGLGCYGCQTLADIASVYGKSSEHIRSVVNRSMEKLRNTPELQQFCHSWEIL